MDCSNLTAAPAKTATNPSPESQSPPPSTSPPPPMVMSPCAACKILRRRCAEKCVLAPYFPPSEPYKFSIAHRVFGASNIIKFLQELPESQRADAVSSMVYEANARIRDPVYGCAGAIFQLQKQVSQLQAELAKAQAELMTTHSHQANLVALLCMEMSPMEPSTTTSYQDRQSPPDSFISSGGSFFDDNNSNNSLSLWDPLWT